MTIPHTPWFRGANKKKLSINITKCAFSNYNEREEYKY
jgi:hypothetical protein